jgi:hypothetical protein
LEAPANELMETTMTAATFDAQDLASPIASRLAPALSAPRKVGPGEDVEWLLIAAHLVGAGSEDPADVGPTSVSELTARLHRSIRW